MIVLSALATLIQSAVAKTVASQTVDGYGPNTTHCDLRFVLLVDNCYLGSVQLLCSQSKTSLSYTFPAELLRSAGTSLRRTLFVIILPCPSPRKLLQGILVVMPSHQGKLLPGPSSLGHDSSTNSKWSP